ncbi:MAG: amino acid ABC transporter ATP-binding protein [Acidimicrobiales bacterium]
MGAKDVALFAFEGVGLRFGANEVLRGVDAAIPASGITALIGSSGAGKSTLLRLCNRLEVPTNGRVLFRGDDLAGIDPLVQRRRAGMVFQRPTLFPGTVLDNLQVADPCLDVDGARALLIRADLDSSFVARDASTLSGGEAQRACLARCLATGPEVVLADEPTSALDGNARHALEALARQLAVEGVPLVWVSHDLDQVRRLADHIIVLDRGTVTVAGHIEVLDAIEADLRRALAEDERGK